MTKATFEGVNYDVRNGTVNKDTLLGGLGNDWIKGGGGNDIIIDLFGNNLFDGGAGSDTITGGIGRDTFIHRMAENTGSRDRYEGGIGTDTLRLELTAAEWARADVQADIAAFLAHTNTTKNKLLSILGLTTDFTFRSMDLTLSNIEKLEVFVNGVELDPKDEKVIARGETLTVTGNGAATIDLLANDSAPDRVASVSFASIPGSAYGQIAVTPSLSGTVQTANLTFTPNAAYAALKAGEVKTETITYTVKDVDGDTATATATIRIVGVNDAPVAHADTATTDEDTPVTINVLANDTDVDVGDALTLVSVAVQGNKGSASIVDGKVVFDTGQDFQSLNAGQSETVTLNYVVKDQSGAQSSSTVTVTINGVNDAPVYASEVTFSSGSTFELAPGNNKITVTNGYTGGYIAGDKVGANDEFLLPNGTHSSGDDLINVNVAGTFSISGDYSIAYGEGASHTDLLLGNDTIVFEGNYGLITGDIQTLYFLGGTPSLTAVFGNDTIIATAPSLAIYGDLDMLLFANPPSSVALDLTFGNDTIRAVGGSGNTFVGIFGDFSGGLLHVEGPGTSAHGRFTLGNDTVYGSDSRDLIFGDMEVMPEGDITIIWGNDVLVGGAGNDQMWGDLRYNLTEIMPNGADTFVFAPGSGHDTIGDFGYGADRLDVSAYGYTNFGQIVWSVDGTDTVVDLDGTAADIASVRLQNYTSLTASDFIFA